MEELGLNPEEVEPLVGRLMIFALHRMRRLRWRGAMVKGGGAVPGWYAPEDFVADAITKALDGTRVWNRSYYPTAERFLESIIQSDINHLAMSSDNAMCRWLSPPSGHDETIAVYDLATTDSKPLQVIINESELARYREATLRELHDDPLLIELFHCYEAEVTDPSEIAQRLGRTVVEINNAKKRLRRKLESVDVKTRSANPQ